MYDVKELTVKEALEQGYTHYVYNDDGYQSLKDIADTELINFNKEDIRIVCKEPQHPAGIDSKEIAELLADHLQCQYEDLVNDDTNSVFDAIMELDFSDMENKIAEALEKINYYSATDIKLIP